MEKIDIVDIINKSSQIIENKCVELKTNNLKDYEYKFGKNQRSIFNNIINRIKSVSYISTNFDDLSYSELFIMARRLNMNLINLIQNEYAQPNNLVADNINYIYHLDYNMLDTELKRIEKAHDLTNLNNSRINFIHNFNILNWYNTFTENFNSLNKLKFSSINNISISNNIKQINIEENKQVCNCCNNDNIFVIGKYIMDVIEQQLNMIKIIDENKCNEPLINSTDNRIDQIKNILDAREQFMRDFNISKDNYVLNVIYEIEHKMKCVVISRLIKLRQLYNNETKIN